jgi:hypothetical protein
MYSTHSTLTYPTLCRRGPKALRAPPKPPTISSDPYSGSECENLTLMYNRLFDFLDDINEEVGEDTAQVDNIGWPDIVRAAAEKGRAKLSKYYSKTGGEQGYLFNCAAVLDPTQKLTVYEVSYYSMLSQSRADRGTRMTRGVLKTGIPTTRNSFNI